MISVIVPVFNTQSYIVRCIDSIIAQTYNDFELILMDDGSTDGSGKICDDYAKKDKRIKVYHQKNVGLVKTRKNALIYAVGDYISFIDSDDWIDSDYLEKMYSVINGNKDVQIDVVAGLHRRELKESSFIIKRAVRRGLYNKERIYNEILPRFFRDYKLSIPGLSASLCTKLFRREIFIEIQKEMDDSITCGEDGAITFPLFLCAENAYILDYCGYHYCYRDDSMTTKLSSDIFVRINTLYTYLTNVLKKYGYEKWLTDQIDAYMDLFLPNAYTQVYDLSVPPVKSEDDISFIPEGSRVVLYGAGRRGARLYRDICIQKHSEVVGWVDRSDPQCPVQMKVYAPEKLLDMDFDYIIISVADRNKAREIRENIIRIGIDKRKIIWKGIIRTKGTELFNLSGYHWRTIENYSKIYIYGAGEYGSELFDKLSRANIPVCSFLVTNKDGEECCRGKKIISIDEFCNDDNTLIVIAVSFSKQAAVISLLEEKDIKNYLPIIAFPPNELEKVWINKPVCNNRIFFDSFRGLGYMCNPKYIAEELLRRNADVDIVWDVTDDANMEFPEGIRTVRRGEPEFYREYYTSHIVVTNMNSVYGPKKRTGQYFINTWHGTGPFKKVGKFVYDITGNTAAYETMKEEYANVDMATAACEQCFVNHRQAFEYEGEIQKWGYPRNDIFFRDPEPIRDKVFESLGLDKNEKMVLYAPTFRYSIKDRTKDLSEIYDIELDKIANALSDKFDSHFRTVYRFHQYIFRELKVTDYYHGSIDATMYPDMQELLVAADVLITDWSSSIWDYSLTGKPVFLYFHDEQDALDENGFYVQPDELPYPKGHSNDELCEEIRNFDPDEYAKHVKGFVDQYGSYDDGHASERIADRIMEIIGDR